MNKVLMTLIAAAFAGTTLTAGAQAPAPAKGDAPKATPATPAAPAKGEAAKATPATPATPSPKAGAAKSDTPQAGVTKAKSKKKAKSKAKGKSKGDGK